MPTYDSSYLGQDGVLETVRHDAQSHAEAERISGIGSARIQSCRRVYFSFLNQDANWFKKELSDLDQAQILLTLSQMLETMGIREAFELLADEVAEIQKKRDQFKRCETIADFLKVCDFNQIAINLALSGDQSGQYQAALEEAAEFLVSEAEAKSQYSKGIKLLTVYSLAALIVVGLLPPVFGSLMFEMVQSGGTTIQLNFASHYMIFMSDKPILSAIAVIALAVGFVYKKDEIMLRGRKLWLLSTLWDLQQIRRGFVFNAVYVRLVDHLNEDELLKLIYESTKSKTNKAIFYTIAKSVRSGKRVGDSLSEIHWPMAMRLRYKTIADMEADDRFKMGKSVSHTLELQLKNIGAKLGAQALAAALIVGIGTVLLMFYGFFLPIMSMSPAGVGM